MKHLNVLLIGTIIIAACSSQPEKGADFKDTIAGTLDGVIDSSAQTMCFQKLAGLSNQDTTSLRLVIDGDNVTGDFGHYPKEKDRRVGSINATRDGELIKGIWVYVQEGMNDTMQVEFKLSGDKLTQKNYTVNPKTGREVFSEASVFNIEFERVSCKD